MKRSIVLDLPAAAAEALAHLLPSKTPLTATPVDGELTADFSAAIVGSFVGETSADLGVVLIDSDDLNDAAGTDSALVSLVDVLRPALEAAVGTLGSGVLGDAQPDDATALFSDPATVVFALHSGGASNGPVAGWFAIRIRESGVVAGPSHGSHQSMVGNLGRISSVEMALTVEIGRTRMSVRDVLSLEPGAVIELDRPAGAPADVLLNGRLIAHGEIVVVDQDYAVRITKILDATEGHS